jgi:hypothetical protein
MREIHFDEQTFTEKWLSGMFNPVIRMNPTFAGLGSSTKTNGQSFNSGIAERQNLLKIGDFAAIIWESQTGRTCWKWFGWRVGMFWRAGSQSIGSGGRSSTE